MSLNNDVLVKLGQKIGLKVDLKDLASDRSLQDIGMDSMSLVKLLYALEDEFDVSIPEEEAQKIVTIGDAIKYVQEHAGNKSQKPA